MVNSNKALFNNGKYYFITSNTPNNKFTKVGISYLVLGKVLGRSKSGEIEFEFIKNQECGDPGLKNVYTDYRGFTNYQEPYCHDLVLWAEKN